MQAQPAKECGIMDIREQAEYIFRHLSESQLKDFVHNYGTVYFPEETKDYSGSEPDIKKREKAYKKLKEIFSEIREKRDNEDIDYERELDEYFAEKYGL